MERQIGIATAENCVEGFPEGSSKPSGRFLKKLKIGTDGSCTCGEHGIMYKLVKSFSGTPETNVTSCVNYTQKQKNKKKNKKPS